MADDPDAVRATRRLKDDAPGEAALRRLVFDHAVARSVCPQGGAGLTPARLMALAASSAPIERTVAALKLIWRAEQIADPDAPLSTPQQIERCAVSLGLSRAAWPERWRDIAAITAHGRRMP